MYRVTHDIQRPNGKLIRIVATPFFGPDMKQSVDTFVLHRDTADEPWKLASDRPHPGWKQMPRSDYIKFGRCEKFQLVSHGELFKVANAARTGTAIPA